jgi:myo-inositol-1(or 4)-monophosphatase
MVDVLAETLADVVEAGRILREGQATVAWGLKPDGSFVTDLDRRIEDQLRARLTVRFPGYDFVGEEGAPALHATGRPRIVLDPIDGTAAFARGLNFYAISLALLDASGAPEMALLHLPGMRRTMAATFGPDGRRRYEGFDLRAAPEVAPARIDDWRAAYLWLGSDPHLQLDLSRWEGKVRALGATAAHLGLVLDGTIDPIGVVVTRYKLWDVAAGLALAEAAGFEIRDLRAEKTVTTADIAGALTLPPLLVALPGVMDHLRPRVLLSPSSR